MASRTILAAVIAILAVTAGCLSAPSAQTAPVPAATGSDGEPTLSVSASGTVSADPDLAVVNVAVIETADTADEARDLAAQSSDRMRAALREAGIDDDAIQTTAYSLSAEYDFSERERRLIGYRVVHAYEIETGVEEAGATIDVAVGNGASSVDGVRFTLTDETERELRAEALGLAVEAARADADAVAAAAGISIAGVQSISTSSGGVVIPFDRALAEEAGGGAATTIEPGPVTVSAHVSVVYTIE